MLPPALLFALFVRSLSLLLPHTFFQPDEFYQAFEPAHRLVFGYGHLTWEWKDLPYDSAGGLRDFVAGGRMRGWIWPGVFALVYKLLQSLGLDQTFLITFAPRIVGVVIAALTDFATYRLSIKVLGAGSGAGAIFLSLTSLFNAHMLTRALSTSPETLLTTLALTYFPLPCPEIPAEMVVGEDRLVASESMKDITTAAESDKALRKTGQMVRVENVAELNYVVMDRMGEHVVPQEEVPESLALSMACVTLAICIRPTTLPFWAFMGLEHLLRVRRQHGVSCTLSVMCTAVAAGAAVFGASTLLDYVVTGRLLVPTLTFINQNLVQNVSSFYGATNPFYHLTQSLPIMLFPLWWWWPQGFVACLLPTPMLPSRLRTLDRPEGVQCLARALTFAIATLSLSPHSEWRFLHPFLPPLLLFALPPLFRSFTPTILGAYRFARSIRQYTRIPTLPFYLAMLAPILPYLYLNALHGAAQVEVMDVLRRGDFGNVVGLAALMPCHSTPWYSALHRDVPAWFLTCEPPLGVDPRQHHTQQDLFQASPVSYLETVFPYPPSPLHKIFDSQETPLHPSHILLFGTLLDKTEHMGDRGHVSVRQALERLGYHEVWRRWNGFDFLQDDAERRGGVRLWAR